jgi:hypothetical protein
MLWAWARGAVVVVGRTRPPGPVSVDVDAPEETSSPTWSPYSAGREDGPIPAVLGLGVGHIGEMVGDQRMVWVGRGSGRHDGRRL